MPRGYPDYQSSREPAIALQTVWEDDFEAPVLKWGVFSTAGSADPVLSTTQAWKGVQSVYFATVAGAGEASRISEDFPLLRRGKVGIEYWIHLENRTPGFMRIRVNILDGTNLTYAELRLDREARTASIVTPAGVIGIATNCFPAIPTTIWVPVKLVVDMVTDLYTQLLIGPDEYDISAHALFAVGPTTDSYINVNFGLEGDAVAIMDAYIDTFILTQNEP